MPLKNEADHIVDCLAALDVAAARLGDRVTVVAFANDCLDASLAKLRAFAPRCIALDIRAASLLSGARHAGWARRLALDAAASHLRRDGDLLLSTDADSQVDPAWLVRTVAHIDAGYDAVAGLALTRKTARDAMDERTRRRFNLIQRYGTAIACLRARQEARVGEPWPRHDYEGGASIALTLGLYHRIGGVPTPPLGEDRALFTAVRAVGRHVRHPVDARVFTSCRLEGRAPGGMADTLNGWATQDDHAPVHETYTVATMLSDAPRGPSQRVTFASLPAELATAQTLISAGGERGSSGRASAAPSIEPVLGPTLGHRDSEGAAQCGPEFVNRSVGALGIVGLPGPMHEEHAAVRGDGVR